MEHYGAQLPLPSMQLPFRGEYSFSYALSDCVSQRLTEFKPDIMHIATPDLVASQVRRSSSTRRFDPSPSGLSNTCCFHDHILPHVLTYARPHALSLPVFLSLSLSLSLSLFLQPARSTSAHIYTLTLTFPSATIDPLFTGAAVGDRSQHSSRVLLSHALHIVPPVLLQGCNTRCD